MDKNQVDYILRYSSHLMTAEEKKAWRHYSTLFKQDKEDISEFSNSRREMLLRNNWITDDHETLVLLKDGVEVFRENTAKRILSDNVNKVVFNYCPKCGKLTRTPKSKQCRYCFHDWR